jgi:hypothetical protein
MLLLLGMQIIKIIKTDDGGCSKTFCREVKKDAKVTLLTIKNLTRVLVVCLAFFYLSVISEFFEFNLLSNIPEVDGSAVVVTIALVIFFVIFGVRARHRH